MRMNRKFSMVFLVILSLSLIISGCNFGGTSGNKDETKLNSEGNLTLEMKNVKSISSDSKVRLRFFNEEKELIKKVDTSENIAKVNLPKGIYSVTAIEHKKEIIKDGKEVYQILRVGEKEKLAVKNNEDVHSTINLTNPATFNKKEKDNTITAQTTDDVLSGWTDNSCRTTFDEWLSVYSAYTFSNTASWDLSVVSNDVIPDGSTVTSVEVEDASIDGRYLHAYIRVENGAGEDHYTNSLNKIPDEFDGALLKQKWMVDFYVDELYSYDATMGPNLYFFFE